VIARARVLKRLVIPAQARVRCLAGLALLAATAAHARGAPPVRVVFDGIEPHVDGLLVQVYDDARLAPQLVLDNRTSRALEILDRRGRSMLSIRPQASYGWFDGRIDPARVRPVARDPAAAPVLGEWRVPALYGGRRIELRGHFRHDPPPAGAYVARLTSARELAPGVHVTLSDGDPPALLVENDGRVPVVVLGHEGEPFLLVSAGGVEANLASPTWQELGRGDGSAAPRGAQVRWQRVSALPRYSWLDARVRRPPPGEPARAWTVPVRVGGRPHAIEGVTQWQPAVY
jgi:hypothetical protein